MVWLNDILMFYTCELKEAGLCLTWIWLSQLHNMYELLLNGVAVEYYITFYSFCYSYNLRISVCSRDFSRRHIAWNRSEYLFNYAGNNVSDTIFYKFEAFEASENKLWTDFFLLPVQAKLFYLERSNKYFCFLYRGKTVAAVVPWLLTDVFSVTSWCASGHVFLQAVGYVLKTIWTVTFASKQWIIVSGWGWV